MLRIIDVLYLIRVEMHQRESASRDAAYRDENNAIIPKKMYERDRAQINKC